MSIQRILAAPPHKELLTPFETARALGVDTKTLGRWARQGKLDCSVRTLGGHRRYAYQQVLEVARTLGIPWAQPNGEVR